jgi:hypothetical protein
MPLILKLILLANIKTKNAVIQKHKIAFEKVVNLLNILIDILIR